MATAVGIDHVQHAYQALTHGDTDRIIAVSRYRSALKQTIVAFFKLLALPAHTLGRLVIVIAEYGRPRDAK